MSKKIPFPTKPFEEWTTEDFLQGLKSQHQSDIRRAAEWKRKKKKEKERSYTYQEMELAFEAGRESKSQEVQGNIQEGILGQDGFYFSDWIEKTLNKNSDGQSK